jgi:3-oxoacyl-[acyl-carrier protein] reductase
VARTAVVTGGGTGVGREIAALLAARGLDVVITGRRADVLAETANAIGARPVAFDATDPGAVAVALDGLPGRVDVLVNNAGGNVARRQPAPEGLAAVRDQWLEAWTADLAFELGGRGITVNVVSPGLVEDTEFFGGTLPDQRRQMLVGQTANGGAGTPADIAAVVAFLTSPDAGHVTGQVVGVNGGAHLGR